MASHMRSTSFPCRSNPRFVRIEEELAGLKRSVTSTKPTAETICNGLSGLEQVYKCLIEVLDLPLTRQSLLSNQNEKWINESLDASLRLLDVCNFVRDFMSQMKGSIKDLQSSLRRRKGDSGIESSIALYSSLRRTMKKAAKKLILQLDHQIPLLELDHQISLVIRVIREVGVVSISVYKSLLVFLSGSTSSASNSTKWSMVSKLLQQRRVACEDQHANMNELEGVDAALNSLCRHGSSDSDMIQTTQISLKTLETRVESVENVSESLSRCLIKARSSLLNIVSQ